MATIDKDHVETDRPGIGEAMLGAGQTGLLDIWAFVRRRKGVLAFGLVAGLALGCLYYYQATPMYESEVTILVAPKDSNLPTQRGVQEGSQSERDRMREDLLSTHLEIFQSRRIVIHAIEKHQLELLPSIVKEREQEEYFDPVEYILEELEVVKGGEGRGKDAHVLCATLRNPSPKDCATILGALVESYQDFLGETFRDTSSEAVELIAQAKNELGEDLKEAEAAYQEFRERAPLLLWKNNKEITTTIHQERLFGVETALAEVRIRYTETKARLGVIEKALQQEDADSLSDWDKVALLSQSDVERLKLVLSAVRGDANTAAFMSLQPFRTQVATTEYQRLLSLLLEERGLLQEYGSGHPRVQKVREQLKAAEAYVESRGIGPVDEERPEFTPADLLAAHVGLLRNDLSELGDRRVELEKLSEQEQKAAKELVHFEIEDEMMRNERERLTELYDAVVDRLREINLIKDYGGFLTEVLSPVEEAKEPASPLLVLVLALGGVLGLFLGAGLAYVADMTDRTFRTPEEVHQALELPLMADIPLLDVKRRKVSASVKREGEPQIDSIVFAHYRPKSREAEAFRGLRTALYFSTQEGGRKVVQITSPNPRDGKTTVAANLAVSIAQSGKKVLLLDADLRHPRIHKILDIDSTIGLSNVIIGEAELHDATQSCGIDNLWILPGGPRPPNPAEVLSSSKFEQLLQVVREQYDLVVVDTPPLLAVTDPGIVASRVDAVLLTIRIVKNGRPQALRAREMLGSLGAEVLGVAINGLDRDPNYGYGYGDRKYGYGYGAGYGYGYAYGYGYGYGYGNGKGDSHYYAEEAEEKEELTS